MLASTKGRAVPFVATLPNAYSFSMEKCSFLLTVIFLWPFQWYAVKPQVQCSIFSFRLAMCLAFKHGVADVEVRNSACPEHDLEI